MGSEGSAASAWIGGCEGSEERPLWLFPIQPELETSVSLWAQFLVHLALVGVKDPVRGRGCRALGWAVDLGSYEGPSGPFVLEGGKTRERNCLPPSSPSSAPS